MNPDGIARINQLKPCNHKLQHKMELNSGARLPRHASPFSFSPSAPVHSPLHVPRAQACIADYPKSLLYWERLRGAAALVADGTASPALHAIALAEQQSVKAEAAAVVATPKPTSRQAPATAGLIHNRVVKSRRGYWRIRHYQPADLLEVAELQAAAFHESLPVGPLNKLAYTLFKAEVLDALKKKVAVLCDDSFAMLVVERCQLELQDSYPLDTISFDSSNLSSISEAESSSDWDAEVTAVWYGDQQAAAVSNSGIHQEHDASTPSSESSSPVVSTSNHSGRIMGVVEVGVHDERDVLQHLANHQGSYAYISSMAVSPQIRRSGIGRALLQAAEQQAVNWKQQLVALHVYTTNTPAIKLYERYGMKCKAQDPAWRGLLGAKVRQLLVKDLSAHNMV